MMTILTTQFSLLLLILLSITTFHKTMCSNHTLVRCNEKDRETLLTFKQGINDSFGMISTWSTEKDCCSWQGVHCDNVTGRVTEIDLKANFEDEPIRYLEGEMNLCILELEFLSYLDLSWNEFHVIRIPSIQHNITHSSKLVYLDLSYNFPTADNLDWLSPLSSLKYLNLSGIDLHKETNWLQIVSTLPSLLELQLSECNLNNFPSVEYLNLSSIVTLHLSYNNFTSHIPDGFFNLTKDLTYLYLSQSHIHGKIPSSLLNLQKLSYLDLSFNKFDVIRIPSIQHNITHSSKLVYLDLSNSFVTSMDNLGWLSPFSSLKYLNLSGIDIHKETNWLQIVNTLPSLLELHLTDCNLNNFPSVEYLNLSSLVTLDLFYSNFTSHLPDGFFNLTKDLTYLQLQGSNMDNLDWLSPLSSLKYLNLNGIDLHKETNWLQIVNTLPSLLELYLFDCNLKNFPSVEYLNLSSIVTLDLSQNNFTSPIPDGFFNLTKDITSLDLWRSNIYGEIPSSLLNLQNLISLYLSYNQLQGLVPEEIGQLAHIQDLYLSENQLQGSIPSTLGNLSSLHYLYIGSNNFSGEFSNLHFSKLYSLDFLDLSNSNFVFKIDLDWVPPFQLSRLSLSNTNQGSHFPSWIYTQKSLSCLDLSSSGITSVDRNKFSNLIERIPGFLILSNNSIAEDISNLTLNCSEISLDHNNFTGGLPNISPKASSVDLSFNSFSGSIPHSWKYLKELTILNLWSNRLSGEVSLHFSDLNQLGIMNLGENEFSGSIPIIMSQNIGVVILRANQFEGTIPQQLFNLSYLFHLDLAHNKLSGSLPHCVYNLTQMDTDRVYGAYYFATVDLFTKGQDYMYRVRPDRRTIDLSANSLSGEVPLELFRLVQVQTLNLSHNNLTGTIPKEIGGMKHMESLDLSSNKFYGEIPLSMALLNFLEVLNLSCNNFDGKIPVGTQLQSFNPSSYIGNPKLCGAPLNNCTTKEENPKTAKPSTENEDDDSIKESLYLGMGVGFAAGFWGICGSLFLIRKWRHACFRFIDRVGDKLYVTLILKLNSFRRN